MSWTAGGRGRPPRRTTTEQLQRGARAQQLGGGAPAGRARAAFARRPGNYLYMWRSKRPGTLFPARVTMSSSGAHVWWEKNGRVSRCHDPEPCHGVERLFRHEAGDELLAPRPSENMSWIGRMNSGSLGTIC